MAEQKRRLAQDAERQRQLGELIEALPPGSKLVHTPILGWRLDVFRQSDGLWYAHSPHETPLGALLIAQQEPWVE